MRRNRNTQIRKYWLNSPELFSEQYVNNLFSIISPTKVFLHRRRKKILSIVGNIKSKKILDVGCGSGIFMLDFINKGATVTGVDYSKKMLSSAANLFKEYKIDNKKYLLLMANAVKLPLKNKSFNLVLATGLLDYMSKTDGNKFLHEASRVLKNDGNAIIGFPAKESLLSFLRSGLGLWIRQNIMKLPPIESTYSIGEIEELLNKNSFKLITKHKIMGAMWLILAAKK